MKITVAFSRILQKLVQVESIEIDVSSYRDIISACVNLLPQFRAHYLHKRLYSQLTLVDGDKYVRDFELDFKPRNARVYMIPTISGGISTAFDSLGNLSVFYGASLPVSSQEMPLKGIDRRIRDSVLYGKASIAFDIAQRRTNRENGTLDNSEDPTRGFGSLASMNAIGASIPLHFGMVRTSGAIISQYIKHIQRGGIDNIRVADYI